jgi:hypothetical protein
VSSAPAAGRDTAVAAGLARLCDFYETLDPQQLAQLGTIYADGARFRDPFNDVRGVPAIRRIFDDMFERTRAPRFVITSRVQQGPQAFVAWDFRFGLGRRELCVAGCSHLLFDESGRVHDHRDYWDTANELYVHLPGIGVLMRWLRRRLSAG